MALLDELAVAKEARVQREAQEAKASQAQRWNEWRAREEQEAARIIAELPSKLREAVNKGNTYEILGLDREADSAWIYGEPHRGMDLERLDGAAMIVRDWCRDQGLTVKVGFEPGEINNGRYYLYVEF